MFWFITLDNVKLVCTGLGFDISLLSQYETIMIYIGFNIFQLLFISFCLNLVYKTLCFIFGRLN